MTKHPDTGKNIINQMTLPVPAYQNRGIIKPYDTIEYRQFADL